MLNKNKYIIYLYPLTITEIESLLQLNYFIKVEKDYIICNDLNHLNIDNKGFLFKNNYFPIKKIEKYNDLPIITNKLFDCSFLKKYNFSLELIKNILNLDINEDYKLNYCGKIESNFISIKLEELKNILSSGIDNNRLYITKLFCFNNNAAIVKKLSNFAPIEFLHNTFLCLSSKLVKLLNFEDIDLILPILIKNNKFIKFSDFFKLKYKNNICKYNLNIWFFLASKTFIYINKNTKYTAKNDSFNLKGYLKFLLNISSQQNFSFFLIKEILNIAENKMSNTLVDFIENNLKSKAYKDLFIWLFVSHEVYICFANRRSSLSENENKIIIRLENFLSKCDLKKLKENDFKIDKNELIFKELYVDLIDNKDLKKQLLKIDIIFNTIKILENNVLYRIDVLIKIYKQINNFLGYHGKKNI